MRQVAVQILSAADTGSATGSVTPDTNQWVSASFQTVCADVTAVGTVKIQASNDAPTGGQARGAFTPTNWSDIPNATAAVTAGVAPMILVPNMAFGYVRAVFTYTSGGSTTIQVNANGLAC